jgi:hypothetical protein
LKRVIAALAGTAALALAGCGGDDEGDVQAFCDRAEEAQAASVDLATPLASGDLDAAKDALDEASGQLQEVADAAPDEISEDFAVVSDYTVNLNDQLQDAESPEDLAKLMEESQANAAAVEEAGTNVEAYLADTCAEDS